MRKATIGWVALAWIATAGSSLAVENDAAETVRVYTNEDIEKLEPIPSQSAPVTGGDLGWGYVDRVLEQGYSRLDAERKLALQRRMVDAETDERVRRAERVRYGLAIAPYGYWGYGRRPGHRPDRPGAGLPERGFANRPVPLHARPNLAQTRMQASGRNSGAGAFRGINGRE